MGGKPLYGTVAPVQTPKMPWNVDWGTLLWHNWKWFFVVVAVAALAGLGWVFAYWFHSYKDRMYVRRKHGGRPRTRPARAGDEGATVAPAPSPAP